MQQEGMNQLLSKFVFPETASFLENQSARSCCAFLSTGLRALSHVRLLSQRSIDEFQINEINVDLRTSGFDNEVLSVDACAV